MKPLEEAMAEAPLQLLSDVLREEYVRSRRPPSGNGEQIQRGGRDAEERAGVRERR